MTLPTSLTLFAAALCLTLASCSKSDSKPNTSNNSNTVVGTMKINCYIPFEAPQTEFIVSEPGGKVLLDTLAYNSGPIVANLKTGDTLLDVTFVTQDTSRKSFNATTYKSLNPSTFPSLIQNSYSLDHKLGASKRASIIYYNIPAAVTNYSTNPGGGLFFTYYFTGATSSSGSGGPSTHSMEFTYDSYPGEYAYFLLPELNLCNLHMQQNAVDSVDCSHLDTAVDLTFNRTIPFTDLGASTLYGIPDTTDLSKVISFTNFGLTSFMPGVDFQYAPMPVQKYEMTYWANVGNDLAIYYAYTRTLPQSLPLFSSSDYTVTSAQPDDFGVTFPGRKLTCYQVNLNDSTVGYSVWLSPDSTVVHPLSLLTNLKSKLLQNNSLSDLKLGSFNIYDFDGYNYSGYFNYITNQADVQAHPVAYVSNLQKSF